MMLLLGNAVRLSIALIVVLIGRALCWSNSSRVDSRYFKHSWRPQFVDFCAVKENNCVVVDRSISRINQDSIVKLFEGEETEARPIRLKNKDLSYFLVVNISSSLSINELHQTYQLVTKFLTVRPWWQVRQLPMRHVPQVILELVPKLVEQSSRAIVSNNFPSLDACQKRPIYLRTSPGSWGNDIMVNLQIFYELFPSAVHMTYMTQTGNVTNEGDRFGYTEPHHCPNMVDRYLCVFMPISNCSVPEIVTSCHDSDCIKEGLYLIPPQSNQKQRERSPKSVPLKRVYREDDPVLREVDFWKFYPRLFPKHGAPDSLSLHMLTTSWSLTNATVEDEKIARQVGNDYHYLNWVFAVFYRPNPYLGLHIQELLAEFYTPRPEPPNHSTKGSNLEPAHAEAHSQTVSNTANSSKTLKFPVVQHHFGPWSLNNRCVAVHIRMGDRILPNTDMIQWCQNHTDKTKTGEDVAIGKWIDGETNIEYGHWADMGCSFRRPYGNVTVEAVVNASLILQPEIKDLLVFTDDHDWLNT